MVFILITCFFRTLLAFTLKIANECVSALESYDTVIVGWVCCLTAPVGVQLDWDPFLKSFNKLCMEGFAFKKLLSSLIQAILSIWQLSLFSHLPYVLLPCGVKRVCAVNSVLSGPECYFIYCIPCSCLGSISPKDNFPLRDQWSFNPHEKASNIGVFCRTVMRKSQLHPFVSLGRLTLPAVTANLKGSKLRYTEFGLNEA